MAYNITALKADLTGALHGTTTNQIQGLDNLINRAARQLLLDVDPQETKRTVQFTAPVFNTVFQYPIAADVKGNKLIDIRPQVQRIPRDVWSQAYNQAFDVAKQNIFASANMFTMNFNTGIKTILINAPYLNPPVIVNQVESVTSNGTWAAGGTASNLAVDNANYVSGAGSLKFDVTSGAAYIENSTMSAVDLSAVTNQSSFFVWVYIPTGSNLTSVNLRIGSSATDYYAATVTANQQATAFVNGWNLCQFIWSSMTTTGSPSASALDYVRVTLNVTGTMTACRVNLIESILGSILEYEYYSKYLFRDSTTGAFQETVTDDSNLINLDTESFNLLFNLVAHYAVQQQQGVDATFYDGNFFGQKYQECLARYKAMYKSELQKPQGVYYRTPDLSNSRYIGRRYNY
jgi:hypothetical protein